jgi:hypothetical protein
MMGMSEASQPRNQNWRVQNAGPLFKSIFARMYYVALRVVNVLYFTFQRSVDALGVSDFRGYRHVIPTGINTGGYPISVAM